MGRSAWIAAGLAMLVVGCSSGGGDPSQQTPDPGPDPATPWTSPYAQWSNGPSTDPAWFPLAVWLQDPGNASGYAALGINLYVGLWQGPTQQQLQTLQAAGMPVVATQNGTALGFGSSTPMRGYQQMDEPDNAQWNGSSYDPCLAPAVMEANYLQWVANDPTRPVFLNFGMGLAYENWIGRGTCTGQLGMYPDYMRGADIVSFDIYPVNSTDPALAGNLWYVAQGVERLVDWNEQYFQGHKVVWNCVELSNIDGVALPTTAQVRAEVWMSIVHGSQGIIYFVHEFNPVFHEAAILSRSEPPYQDLRAGVTALNAQVTALAPVLNSARFDSEVAVDSSAAGVPLRATVRHQGGKVYVIAVAMRDAPTTGTFSLSGLTPASTVEVVDEQRSITPGAGSFTDSFDGYGVHIYRITP